MTGSDTNRAAARAFALAVALAIVFSWAVTFLPEGHDWGGDFSLYIAHARNIANGHTYGDVDYIPETGPVPPQGPPSYPPGFPLVIAPAVGMWGLDYTPMRAVVQAMWLLSGVLFYWYGLQRGATPLVSASVVGVFLLASIVLTIKNSVLSDSTYLVLSAAALLYLEWLYRHREIPAPIMAGVIIGLLLIAAYLTRVTAAALVGAVVLQEIYRAKRIRTFAVAAGVTFLAGFVLYRLTLYDGGGYASQFRLTPDIWASNAVAYLKSPASIWGGLPAALRYPAAILLVILGTAGLFRRYYRGPSPADFYVVLYMIPLLVYSSGANMRYIVAILPLVLFCGAEAFGALLRRLPEASRRPVLAALALFLIVGAAANVAVAARTPAPEGPEMPTFQEAVRWIRSNTGPDDPIVAWNPRVVALYTERPVAFYMPSTDQTEFEARLEQVRARWMLFFNRSPLDKQWLQHHIQARPSEFVKVWENKDFAIYQVRR